MGLTQGGKRRRVDKDLQSAIIHSAMQEGRARTPGALARASHSLNEKTVVSWVPRHMSVYAHALRLALEKAPDIAVAYDASRVGQPKKDILSVAVVNVQTNFAGWLPPQVSLAYMGGGPDRRYS